MKDMSGFVYITSVFTLALTCVLALVYFHRDSAKILAALITMASISFILVLFQFLLCIAEIPSMVSVIHRTSLTHKEPYHISYMFEKEEQPMDSSILEGEDLYRSYVYDICQNYPEVDPYMIEAMIYHESRWDPNAINYNGTCVGLMQLSTKWHMDRAEKLGKADLWDPYTNILTGVDLMAELIDTYEDPALALMMYHMRHDRARELYNQGILSGYTKSVLAMTEELKKGDI